MRYLSRLAAVFALLFCAASIKADTYQIFGLGNDNGGVFYGFDPSGNFTISEGACALDPYSVCYKTFARDGTQTNLSLSRPTYGPNNGTPCSVPVSPAFTYVEKELCNGGFLSVLGTTTPNPSATSFKSLIFPDGDPSFSLPYSSSVSILALDQYGDIFYNDAFLENFYYARDLTSANTPEPSSFALLVSGLLGVAGALRRRIT